MMMNPGQKVAPTGGAFPGGATASKGNPFSNSGNSMGLYDFSMPYDESNNGEVPGAAAAGDGATGEGGAQSFPGYGSSPFGSHEYH
jgi:hypothetical protein